MLNSSILIWVILEQDTRYSTHDKLLARVN